MTPSSPGTGAWPGSRLAGMRSGRRMMRQMQEKSKKSLFSIFHC